MYNLQTRAAVASAPSDTHGRRSYVLGKRKRAGVSAGPFDSPLGLGCSGISTRWTNEPRRPPFERHPARIRDAVALDSRRRAARPNGFVSRSCKPCADEASDCVTTDRMDEYKRFLRGAVRAAGK
jgi:hypothetical protein